MYEAYDVFVKNVKSELKSAIGSGFTINTYYATKNNGVDRIGVSIKPEDSNIAPVIYLEDYYQGYTDGTYDMGEIVNDILRIYSDNRQPSFDVDRIQDYNAIKHWLFFKVVNRNLNEELLKIVPHYDILDLAIVFGIYAGVYHGSFSSILIKNDHLEMWGIDEHRMRDDAFINTPIFMPIRYYRMDEILMQMGVKEQVETGIPMYVLTNQQRISGAGVIFYPNELDNMLSVLHTDKIFILPSSVHETIAIPYCDDVRAAVEMIRDINRTVVNRDEVLSDSLYSYTNEDGLQIVKA